LLLALVHALTAYAAGSRLVLAAALTAFAGWMGADPRLGELWLPRTGLLDAGARALALAALYGLARWLHVRRRGRRDLAAVYEQFAVNFAFWGALALGFAPSTRWAGAVLLVLVALWVGRSGLRHRRETFVLYAIGYSTFGLVALEAQLIDDVLLASNVGLATVVVAIMLLFRLRARLKEARE
jgi:hypothetical protein